MKTLFPEFFRKKRVEGEGSDKKSYLDVLKMQTDPLTRDAFVCYAAYDAKSTWEVHDVLKQKLSPTGLGAHGEQSLVERHAGDDVGLLRAVLRAPSGIC